MVKVQKPIPKKMGNKPKLDNPIKQKKQQLKKEKSATTKTAKFLDDSTPVKDAKVALKPGKGVITKKKLKKELNGEKKTAKKPLILAPESPEQKQNGKGKKNQVGNGKNVVTNGIEKAKSTVAPEKAIKKIVPVQNGRVSEKSAKPTKEIKAPAAKEVPVPVKLAPPSKAKAAPVPPTKPKAAPAPSKAAALQKKTIVAAPPTKAKAESIALNKPKAAPAGSKAAAPQKKVTVLAPAPQKNSKSVAPQKKGKNQKNKKKAAPGPEPEPTPALEKIKKVKKPKDALQEKKVAKIAFKKAKQAAQNGKPKTEKKLKIGTTFRYDPIPYDEEKFNEIVNIENIKKIAQALKTTVEEEVKKKKSSIFDDYRYFLNVGSFKIPCCPKRMVRLNLKHSLVDKDDDVLLVVPDLKRGSKVDYEPTKHHYEDLLRQKGIEGITVMPMNQLRREYRTFEQKRRLCASYEYYICDGRIIGHVGSFVGKLTQKTRNTFHPVRLDGDRDIKVEIEKSLKKTAFRQLTKSSLQSIPVGSHKFSFEQLAENIELVVSQLKKVFPGGLGNIRNIHLKIGLTGTSSLPLYISMAQAPEETPMVIGTREERMLKLKREANEVLSKFTMTKDGKMIKLTRSGVEKKRKLQEMKAALTEDQENDEPAKKAKKVNDGKKKKVKEVKELELPESEEEDDDDTGDEDDEDVVQLGQGSDDETEDDEMANLDEEDTESGAEIVENGFVGEDDEESEEDDEQEVNQSEIDEDDDDEDEETDDDDEAEEDEESD